MKPAFRLVPRDDESYLITPSERHNTKKGTESKLPIRLNLYLTMQSKVSPENTISSSSIGWLDNKRPGKRTHS